MSLDLWFNNELSTIAKKIEDIDKELIFNRKALRLDGKEKIKEILKIYKYLVFPEYYHKNSKETYQTSTYFYENLQKFLLELRNQVKIIFEIIDDSSCYCKKIEEIIIGITNKLPLIKTKIQNDIKAAYFGDPAAFSFEEILLCYPSIEVISIHRLAHELYAMNVPILPRILSEYAHQLTGIDIHPGATIGDYFFIDHGTGVVIGETCIIGNNVKLYQGVTLGAKNFPLDNDGHPVKGIKRHPNIEDNVIIYAGATILGGDTTIGHNTIIGGNIWVDRSIPPYSSVYGKQISLNIKNKATINEKKRELSVSTDY
ncbi:serine O-acetyltransferase EpsC [Rummeliibacillus pycnus]|uniref:serine O-acetyltransferase EpsC n=1 Tax=Rummeliibacillus pycnus TaxID=101070 RepID=UPI003D293104